MPIKNPSNIRAILGILNGRIIRKSGYNNKIREEMGVTLFRFDDSAYIKLGQIGFLAWVRAGGNLADVGGCLKYYANSAT